MNPSKATHTRVAFEGKESRKDGVKLRHETLDAILYYIHINFSFFRLEPG